MSQKSLLSLAAAGAMIVLLGPAHAQNPPPDGGVRAALAALSQVDSALVAWARTETVDSDVKRAVLDSPPLAGEVPAADPARGLTAETAAQTVLAAAEQRLVDLLSKIRHRETELVYGATATPEAGQPADVVEERIDVRSLIRSPGGGSLPLVGIPLPGMPANDERLHAEELGCDAERLADLVASEISEEPTANVDSIDGTIVLRATQGTAARVRSSLEQLQEIASRRVQVELRAWRITRALKAELARLSDGVALSPAAEKKLAQDGVLLGEEALVTGDGRIARTWRGEARAYVAEVSGMSSGVDTIGRMLHTGFFAEVVPRVDPGAKTATVSVRFALSEAKPSARVKVLGEELELPELELARTATTTTIPFGRSALVGGSFGLDEQRGDEKGAADASLACVLCVKATLLAAPKPAPAVVIPGGRPDGERALAALDKETLAEIRRLESLIPHIERALSKVRLARERHVEVLDVRDLLITDTGALSLPRLGIIAPSTAEDEAVPSGVDAERLEGLIKRSTGGDEAWAAPAWLGMGRGALFVRQTPTTLATVQGIVAALRRDRRGLIEIETGLYRTSAAFAGQVSGAVSREALARLEDEVKEGRATFVSGGFVVARAGEKVSVLACRERAFVAGSTPLGNLGGSAPTIALARTGFRLGVRARLDRGCIAAEVDASSARLRSVASHEGAHGTTVQPSIELDAATHEVLLADGTGFGLVRARSAAGVLVLVIRARSL